LTLPSTWGKVPPPPQTDAMYHDFHGRYAIYIYRTKQVTLIVILKNWCPSEKVTMGTKLKKKKKSLTPSCPY
jgi:hypothetical protein